LRGWFASRDKEAVETPDVYPSYKSVDLYIQVYADGVYKTIRRLPLGLHLISVASAIRSSTIGVGLVFLGRPVGRDGGRITVLDRWWL
jgi:hypothetical protein